MNLARRLQAFTVMNMISIHCFLWDIFNTILMNCALSFGPTQILLATLLKLERDTREPQKRIFHNLYVTRAQYNKEKNLSKAIEVT